MSTTIYPGLDRAQSDALVQRNKKADQKWLIEQIIKPELPNIIETLIKCIDLIVGVDMVKLPITSARTEQVKGVVTRIGTRIESLDIVLQLHSLSKKLNLKLVKPFELKQLRQLLDLITTNVTKVELLVEQKDLEIEDFTSHLKAIMENLIKCNGLLTKPSESLLFPKHKIDLTKLFKDEHNLLHHYQDRLTMDFFLLSNEISIEFKSLEEIKQHPWSEVDSNGVSFIDKLRDDIKYHKTSLHAVLQKYDSNNNKLVNLLGLHKFSTNDYLTRGITFNNKVVIEVEKLVIHCQDPNLLSVGAKLNGLEHLVGKMFKNLNMTVM